MRGPFADASRAIGRQTGNELGKRQFEQLVRAAVLDVDAFCDSRQPAPPQPGGVGAGVTMDGKGVVMRTEALRQLTACAAKNKDRGWPRLSRARNPGVNGWPRSPASTTPNRSPHPGRDHDPRRGSGAARPGREEREAADTCADYLSAKKPYLDYALTCGWPIATDIIHLVKDRMDLTGARWGPAGAEAILEPRALAANGDFEDYWRFHL